MKAHDIERAVRDVFEKRFLGQLMTYEKARELVWLERELITNLVHTNRGEQG